MLDGNKIGRQNSICNLNIKPFLLHFFLHPFNPSPSRELSRSSSASNTWWGEEAWPVHCTIQGIDQTLFSLCVGVRVSVCPSLALYVDLNSNISYFGLVCFRYRFPSFSFLLPPDTFNLVTHSHSQRGVRD